MNFISDNFNNREIASGIWMLIAIIALLFVRDIRKSFSGVLSLLFKKTLITIISIMFLYISMIIYLLYFLKLWDIMLLKDTIYWSLGVAFIMLMNANKANQDSKYFKKIFLDNLKLIILIEFIVNFQPFNLFWELILFPILLFFVFVQTFTEDKIENKMLNQLSNIVLSIVGIIYLTFAIRHIIKNLNDFLSYSSLRSLLFAPVMTILYLPFVYFIALYMRYESYFRLLKFRLEEKKGVYYYARLKIFLFCSLNLKKLNRFASSTPVYNFDSKEEIRKTINEYKKHPIANK